MPRHVALGLRESERSNEDSGVFAMKGIVEYLEEKAGREDTMGGRLATSRSPLTKDGDRYPRHAKVSKTKNLTCYKEQPNPDEPNEEAWTRRICRRLGRLPGHEVAVFTS